MQPPQSKPMGCEQMQCVQLPGRLHQDRQAPLPANWEMVTLPPAKKIWIPRIELGGADLLSVIIYYLYAFSREKENSVLKSSY